MKQIITSSPPDEHGELLMIGSAWDKHDNPLPGWIEIRKCKDGGPMQHALWMWEDLYQPWWALLKLYPHLLKL
jgi:hypothetical protein